MTHARSAFAFSVVSALLVLGILTCEGLDEPPRFTGRESFEDAPSLLCRLAAADAARAGESDGNTRRITELFSCKHFVAPGVFGRTRNTVREYQ
jgi:hypothetical protein